MHLKSIAAPILSSLICLSAGVAAAQSDNEQKPAQLNRQLPGASGNESGASSPQPGDVRSRLSFAPEQRTRIREYVLRENVAPVTGRLVVGERVPAEMELRSAPADWGPSVSGYRYVYSDNHVYFVAPATREVVGVIE
jgi:hypothetical protein